MRSSFKSRRAIAPAAILIAALAIILLVGRSAPAASNGAGLPSLPPTGRLDYKVLRDGDEIGFQSFEFRRDGDRLTVVTHAEVVVTLFGISFYRFTHEAEEQWWNGRLVSLASYSDDDGERRVVTFRAEGDRLHGTYNGHLRDYPGTLIPASLWDPETVHQTVLLDPYRGRARQITVADRGEETLEIKGNAITAHHYTITDKNTGDIWYDSTGQLVRFQFSAWDGSKIQILLR